MYASLYTLKTFSDDNIMNSYSSNDDKHISQVVGFPYSILAEVNQMVFFQTCLCFWCQCEIHMFIC